MKFSAMGKNIQEEYRHLGNFAPVFLIIGILCAIENVSLSLIFILGSIGCLGFLRKKTRVFGLLIGMTVLGYCVMSYRSQAITVPVLNEPVRLELKGVVQEAHLTPWGQKIILDHIVFLNRYDLASLEKVKLNLPLGMQQISEKDTIKVSVFLRPPLGKTDITGYDEFYHLKFQKIGAVGQVKEILDIQKSNQYPALEQMRQSILKRIQKAVPKEVAEVLIPLSIGEQSVVSDKIYRLFRSGGITHILSVSGFHLSLLAFFIFLIVRRLFSLSPKAEYFNSKKIAAVLALSGATGYIFISGMQVPAVRSWIMIAIVLIAILFNRNAVSVRSLSIAAIGILCVRPELILNIGFQLSFMAVLILTTLYPIVKKFICNSQSKTIIGQFFKYVLSFILIDFLISIATTPFVIYHFNLYALYSPIGNVLMGTIVSFWVMPLLFIALILMPVGGEVLFLKGAGIGVEYVIALCSKINAWPYSLMVFPSFGERALGIMALGIILLCLMKTKLRLMGIVFLVCGIAMAVFSPKPDLMIGDKGQTVALRKNNKLVFISKGLKNDTAQNWLLHNGEDFERDIPQVSLPPLIMIKGYKIAFQEENCQDADICFLNTNYPLSDKVYRLNERDVQMVYFYPDKIKVVCLKKTQ